MKTLDKLSKELLVWSKRVETKAIEKHKEVAQKICADIKSLAPGNGKYSASIKVGDTIIRDGVVKTAIYTDMMSENHAVGRMIEHGTGIYALEPHIGHTSVFFKSNYNYWYVPATSIDHAIGRKIIIDGKEFYVAYAQKPKPHFLPALNSNKEYYMKKIKESIKL